jgi:TetR/AcrR family tetracycline transcriptional repressor
LTRTSPVWTGSPNSAVGCARPCSPTARLVSGTYVRRPTTLRLGEAAVRAATAAGIADEQAALAFFTLQDYVLGHTIEEQSRDELLAARAKTPQPTPEETEEYPVFGAAIGHWAATDADARFGYGLDVLIDGLRSRHCG